MRLRDQPLRDGNSPKSSDTSGSGIFGRPPAGQESYPHFCNEHSVNVNTSYIWKRKVRRPPDVERVEVAAVVFANMGLRLLACRRFLQNPDELLFGELRSLQGLLASGKEGEAHLKASSFSGGRPPRWREPRPQLDQERAMICSLVWCFMARCPLLIQDEESLKTGLAFGGWTSPMFLS